MDQIWLKGVECRVNVGVPLWERKKRQKVLIDIGLELDLSKAGLSDDICDTVDYWAIERQVRGTAEHGEFKLVERLAAVVADKVLEMERKLRSVTVLVHKKPSVMPKTREIVVELQRTRRKS